MTRNLVDRRHALLTFGSVVAGAATPSLWVESLTAFARDQAHAAEAQAAIAAAEWAPTVLSPQQNETVIALTELIIPQTDTPGAKAARVNRFVDRVLSRARTEDRDAFLSGLAWIDRRSRELFEKDFVSADVESQTKLLTRLSAEGNPDREEQTGVDFFRAIKSMTINGYYTTEIGLRQELGDPGQLYQRVSEGCDHPEHQR